MNKHGIRKHGISVHSRERSLDYFKLRSRNISTRLVDNLKKSEDISKIFEWFNKKEIQTTEELRNELKQILTFLTRSTNKSTNLKYKKNLEKIKLLAFLKLVTFIDVHDSSLIGNCIGEQNIRGLESKQMNILKGILIQCIKFELYLIRLLMGRLKCNSTTDICLEYQEKSLKSLEVHGFIIPFMNKSGEIIFSLYNPCKQPKQTNTLIIFDNKNENNIMGFNVNVDRTIKPAIENLKDNKIPKIPGNGSLKNKTENNLCSENWLSSKSNIEQNMDLLLAYYVFSKIHGKGRYFTGCGIDVVYRATILELHTRGETLMEKFPQKVDFFGVDSDLGCKKKSNSKLKNFCCF